METFSALHMHSLSVRQPYWIVNKDMPIETDATAPDVQVHTLNDGKHKKCWALNGMQKPTKNAQPGPTANCECPAKRGISVCLPLNDSCHSINYNQ